MWLTDEGFPWLFILSNDLLAEESWPHSWHWNPHLHTHTHTHSDTHTPVSHCGRDPSSDRPENNPRIQWNNGHRKEKGVRLTWAGCPSFLRGTHWVYSVHGQTMLHNGSAKKEYYFTRWQNSIDPCLCCDKTVENDSRVHAPRQMLGETQW